MNARYDCIVVGVGAIGSAATYHLASRGYDVLGLERYDIPHTMGSSHGITRLHSFTTGRGAEYVAVAERAYELWRELGDAAGETIYRRTGHVRAWPDADAAGHRGGIEDARTGLDRWGLEYERLSGAEVNDRWPGYGLPAEYEAIYQPDSGFLDPELTISTHVREACRCGATVRARERVLDWNACDDGVSVTTETDTYEADALVVAAGPWAAKWIDGLEGIAVPERRVMAWFQPETPDRYLPKNFPTFSIDTADSYYYGAPIHRVPGFKVGNRPQDRKVIDPNEMNRETSTEEVKTLRRFATRYFPDGAGPTTRATACIITMTPDEEFVVDTHPKYDHVAFTGGFSGSGFHVSSAIGELLADRVTRDDPMIEPSLFALE